MTLLAQVQPALGADLNTLLIGAVGTLFGALMLEMRGRRDRAEKQADALLQDVPKLVGTVSDLTSAVRELHALIADKPPRR